MPKPRDVTDRRSKNERASAQHRNAHRFHRKNPCPHGPRMLDNATEMFGEYVLHEGPRRHNRWQANLRWNEIDVDSDGFPLQMREYVLEIQYSANNVDWFDHSRHLVPTKRDDDPNDKVHWKIKHIHPRLAYRYRIAARSQQCQGDFSDYFNLGTAVDTPLAPVDVEILRASHGIRLHWDAYVDTVDDSLFDESISYFVAELWTDPDFPDPVAFNATASNDRINITGHGLSNGDVVMLSRNTALDPFPGGKLKVWHPYYVVNKTVNSFQLAFEAHGTEINITSDGDGRAYFGLVRKGRHLHKHGHLFKIHVDDFDEDVRFYGRVEAVSDAGNKSAWIPATAPDPNDDPLAEPTGRRPAWHRRVLTANIVGDLEDGTYVIPNRLDDDYKVQRMTAAFHHGGDGAFFDVKVNGAYFVADQDPAYMLELAAGTQDATAKGFPNPYMDRGDHIRLYADLQGGDPPSNGTVHLICDRVTDGPTTDSGGGGDEGDSS